MAESRLNPAPDALQDLAGRRDEIVSPRANTIHQARKPTLRCSFPEAVVGGVVSHPKWH